MRKTGLAKGIGYALAIGSLANTAYAQDSGRQARSNELYCMLNQEGKYVLSSDSTGPIVRKDSTGKIIKEDFCATVPLRYLPRNIRTPVAGRDSVRKTAMPIERSISTQRTESRDTLRARIVPRVEALSQDTSRRAIQGIETRNIESTDIKYLPKLMEGVIYEIYRDPKTDSLKIEFIPKEMRVGLPRGEYRQTNQGDSILIDLGVIDEVDNRQFRFNTKELEEKIRDYLERKNIRINSVRDLPKLAEGEVYEIYKDENDSIITSIVPREIRERRKELGLLYSEFYRETSQKDSIIVHPNVLSEVNNDSLEIRLGNIERITTPYRINSRGERVEEEEERQPQTQTQPAQRQVRRIETGRKQTINKATLGLEAGIGSREEIALGLFSEIPLNKFLNAEIFGNYHVSRGKPIYSDTTTETTMRETQLIGGTGATATYKDRTDEISTSLMEEILAEAGVGLTFRIDNFELPLRAGAGFVNETETQNGKSKITFTRNLQELASDSISNTRVLGPELKARYFASAGLRYNVNKNLSVGVSGNRIGNRNSIRAGIRGKF